MALLGAGAELYLDFAGFIFHVPMNGSAASGVIAATSPKNVDLRAIFDMFLYLVPIKPAPFRGVSSNIERFRGVNVGALTKDTDRSFAVARQGCPTGLFRGGL